MSELQLQGGGYGTDRRCHEVGDQPVETNLRLAEPVFLGLQVIPGPPSRLGPPDPDTPYPCIQLTNRQADRQHPERCSTFHAIKGKTAGPPASPGGSGCRQLGRVTAMRGRWRSR